MPMVLVHYIITGLSYYIQFSTTPESWKSAGISGIVYRWTNVMLLY